MDVINLSLGEPEIDAEPRHRRRRDRRGRGRRRRPRDRRGQRLRGRRGRLGRLARPRRPQAITVAAVTNGRGAPADVIADFSSGGPTPISLQLKPDVSAPGVDVALVRPDPRRALGHLQRHEHGDAARSPAAAALLLERHPDWTVAQVKSALVLTGDPAYIDRRSPEAATTREGGGLIDIPRANTPLIFAAPASRLVRPSCTAPPPPRARSRSPTRAAAPAPGRVSVAAAGPRGGRARSPRRRR